MKIVLFTLLVLFSLPSMANTYKYKCEIQGYGTIFNKEGIPQHPVKFTDMRSETMEETWRDCAKLAQKWTKDFKHATIINLDGGQATRKTRNAIMFLYMDYTFTNTDNAPHIINGQLNLFTRKFQGYPIYGDRRRFSNGDYFTSQEE